MTGHTTPTEPADWHLDRIEASARLVTGNCPHCHAEAQVVSRFPGTNLPRAISWRHEDGCPSNVGAEA